MQQLEQQSIVQCKPQLWNPEYRVNSKIITVESQHNLENLQAIELCISEPGKRHGEEDTESRSDLWQTTNAVLYARCFNLHQSTMIANAQCSSFSRDMKRMACDRTALVICALIPYTNKGRVILTSRKNDCEKRTWYHPKKPCVRRTW